MSILSIPSGIVPNALDMALQSNTQIFTSELNGATQTSALPGDKWVATLTFANRSGEEARKIRAFVAALRGRSGRFYFTPFDHRTPDGVATGAPLVKGGSQSGAELVIDGCTPNVTGWLLAGDYFQVGNELKLVTEDIDTDASGNATLKFVPPLRTSPPDNDPITTSNPKCIMMLSDDQQSRHQVQPGHIYALSISCEEALV